MVSKLDNFYLNQEIILEDNISNKIFKYYEEFFFYNLNILKSNPLFLFHSNYDIFNNLNFESNINSYEYYYNKKAHKEEKSKTIDFISNINKSININTIEEFIYDLDFYRKIIRN